ncbi:MAG: molybdenum cofactor guanylyltransferase [Burkholderiales bacterium RIFCSPLOWO2_02_FULL_57_36]|nr:MAG: molybdenum cofactor guanylyltransferase [Burkholderiales bacterium RIFCSPLOWO2_02_FULL_57_36]
MTIQIDQITGLILAGGRGSRMGEADKGLQLLRGIPMALHAITRLAPQVSTLTISANRNVAAYEAFGVPVRPDEVGNFAGPLAGLQTALSYCSTEYLVTAPCDSPFLPLDLVAALGNGLSMQNADLAFAVTGINDMEQIHPVFCLLRTALLPDLNRYIGAGGRKITAWHASLCAAKVHFSNEDAFQNINTLEDLRKFDKD